MALIVQLSDDGRSWRTIYTHNGSMWKVLNVPARDFARFVRVGLTNVDPLQLYEVEVWGRRPQRPIR